MQSIRTIRVTVLQSGHIRILLSPGSGSWYVVGSRENNIFKFSTEKKQFHHAFTILYTLLKTVLALKVRIRIVYPYTGIHNPK